MIKTTQKEIEELKQTYKKKYHKDLSDEKTSDIIDAADRYSEIIYEQIIDNIEQKKTKMLKKKT